MKPLPKIKRAVGKKAGGVTPEAWDSIVDAIEEIGRRLQALCPRSSQDIKVKGSLTTGFTYWLARKQRLPTSEQPCPLQPELARVEDIWYLWIRPGFSGSLIPTFDAAPISEDNLQPVSAATKLWLKVTWEPVSDYDADLEIYWIVGGGSLVSAEFIFSASTPADTDAEIDESTGAATNGVYHFLWADITYDGRPIINASRCGNHQFSFCPGTMTIVFDRVIEYIGYY